MRRKLLVILPCNRGIYYGNYMLGENWRIVYKYIGDLVEKGAVDLGAIDCCKPGIILRGEEYKYIGCDILPYWNRKSMKKVMKLKEYVKKDLKDLSSRYDKFIFYVNVKLYHLALKYAMEELIETGCFSRDKFIDIFPGKYSPLAYRCRRNLMKLRNKIAEVLANAGFHSDA